MMLLLGTGFLQTQTMRVSNLIVFICYILRLKKQNKRDKWNQVYARISIFDVSQGSLNAPLQSVIAKITDPKVLRNVQIFRQ